MTIINRDGGDAYSAIAVKVYRPFTRWRCLHLPPKRGSAVCWHAAYGAPPMRQKHRRRAADGLRAAISFSFRAGRAPFPPSSAGQCLVMTMRSLCALVRCPGMIDDAGGDCPHACPRRSVTAHSQPQRSHSPRQTTVPTALTGRSPSSSWPAVSRCPAAAARRRARPPAFAARAHPPRARCVSPRAPCAARSGWRRR